MRIVALVFAFALAACSGNPKPPTPVPAETRPIVIGESRLIRSTALGDDRQINIWLPPSYKSPAGAILSSR